MPLAEVPPLLPMANRIEIRYPMSFRFIDHIGWLADAFRDLYDEVALTPAERLEFTDENGQSGFVTVDRCFFGRGEKEDLTAMQDRAVTGWALLEATLELQAVTRVGVRTDYLRPFVTVDDAVDSFRRNVFDHHGGIWSGLGVPKEVRSHLRVDDWRTGEFRFGLSVRITPIHFLPDLKHALDEDRYDGGLVFDLDTFCADDLMSARVPEAVRAASEAGFDAAGLLSSRLSENGESAIAT